MEKNPKQKKRKEDKLNLLGEKKVPYFFLLQKVSPFYFVDEERMQNCKTMWLTLLINGFLLFGSGSSAPTADSATKSGSSPQGKRKKGNKDQIWKVQMNKMG